MEETKTTMTVDPKEGEIKWLAGGLGPFGEGKRGSIGQKRLERDIRWLYPKDMVEQCG